MMISDDFDFLSPKYILRYILHQLAMLISHLYYYLVYFVAFLQTLCMNFVKQNR